MGCGESKLAVSTSNTILRRKKSNVGESSKKSKDIETVLENNDKATAQQQQQPVDDNQGREEQVKEENISNNDIGGGESLLANVNVKDIDVNHNDDGKEALEKGNKEGLDEAEERLISHGSPNRFFSSRKLEEEGIDGIISEGRSGTSDYYTPRHGSKGNLHFKVDDDIAEDDQELAVAPETKAPETEKNEPGTSDYYTPRYGKGNLHFKVDDDIVEDNKELALAPETKAPEAQKNEEPVKVEENLVKEAEVTGTTSTVEAKVSQPIPAAEEEKTSI